MPHVYRDRCNLSSRTRKCVHEKRGVHAETIPSLHYMESYGESAKSKIMTVAKYWATFDVNLE